MASITFNGQGNPSLMTFSEVPNILRISDDVSGSKSMITLNFLGTASATGNSQYYITILDETIENVASPEDVSNRRFFLADPTSTAASVAFALMNCASLFADFDITYNGGSVYLYSRENGSKLNVVNPISTNIPSSLLSCSMSDGTAGGSISGGKIIVKVMANGSNVTTLVKNFHDDGVSFDVSPVLSTFSEYGIGKTYSLLVDSLGKNGIYRNLGSVNNNIVTNGYNINGSERYLPLSNRILLNTNGGKLYTYFNTIALSVLTPNQSASATWTAYTSNNVQLANGSSEASPVNGYISDIEINVPTSAFNDAYSVKVNYGSTTISFYVIKPLKAAEKATRVYWRNCYGGISFWDFTGAETESNSIETETYIENFYDMYIGGYEGEKIYKSDLSHSITLTSHLIEKDGTISIYDLAKSKRIWTTSGDKTIFLIPSSIEVTESDTYNDIYTVKASFRYGKHK